MPFILCAFFKLHLKHFCFQKNPKQIASNISPKPTTESAKRNNNALNNPDESSASKGDSRDPRIRKIKPIQNADKVSVIESNIFEPKASVKSVSASPTKVKSKNLSNNISTNSSNGLKRSSPNKPNSLNQTDFKKPKLTGNHTSPDKSTKITKTQVSSVVQQPEKTERCQEQSTKNNLKSSSLVQKAQKTSIPKGGWYSFEPYYMFLILLIATILLY